MHFTEFDTRLAAYALLVNDADEILLTWFNGEGRVEPGWTMPGGGVEFDESIPDAVVREVFEETGYHVVVGDIIGQRHFISPSSSRSDKPFRSQQFLLAATIVGGELGTTEVDGTTDHARWIPISEVPHLDVWRSDTVDLALSLL